MAPSINTNPADNLNNENIEIYVSTIRILLQQVKNKSAKERFNRRFTSAVMQENESSLMALMKDMTGYISRMSGRTSREAKKKEPVYEEPPTFDRAVIDLVHQCCADLENFPELKEYFSEVDKKLWEKVAGKKKEKKEPKKKEKEPRDWPKKKAPKMRQVDKIETIVKRDMVVASAACQSGKSNFMICSGIKGMVHGRVPVFVTRNVTGDADQLQRGCENFGKVLEDYLAKHGVSERKFKIETLRACDLDKENCKLKAMDAFNGKALKMIICLGNATQLNKVLSLAKETTGSINLFIDEVDYVDYGEGSETSYVLKDIKDYSYQVVGISGTPMAVMFNEEDLRAKNQLRMQPPSDYRGFVDIVYKPFDKGATSMNHKATYSQIISSDPNLEKFLKEFSKSKPVKAVVIDEFIPNICLIKNSRFIENQECLFDAIVKKYKDMVAMVYNGSGVKMHVPGENFEGYQKMNISDALQYLRDNGGVKKFKNIIIIAGDLAGRCISYVPKDYSWHLTKMYYLPASSTPIPELIQSAGRLCGRNRGKGSLELHAPLKVIDALFKGFKFTDEVIDRAIASPAMSDEGIEKNFAESLKSVPMNKDKAPPASRKLVTKADIKKGDFNLVKGNDGGLSMRKYEYKTEEVGTEKQQTESGGEWRKIIYEKLGAKSQKYYKQIVKAIEEDQSYRGGSITNSEVLDKITTDKKEKISLNSTVWNWHSDENNGKMWTLSEGKEKGLYFKLENKIWIIKYNN